MVYLIIFTVVVLIFTSIVGNKLKKQNFLIDLKLKNFFQNNNLRFCVGGLLSWYSFELMSS